MSGVVLEQVEIAYGDVVAVDDVSLEIQPGEVHVLLGHSGSGKTTILRALAGFERARKGTVTIGTTTVDGSGWLAPEKRPVGLVFQDYALFPHMNVAKNIGFGVDGNAESEVRRLLDLIGLASRAEAMPGELSGGEQQRVALARALARRPELLLMDEPFSNLDPDLRAGVRRQTFELVRELGITTLLVTHTADEAMEVGDRISVIERGKLLQTGSARELYRHPRTVAVAKALGAANVVPATGTGEGWTSKLGDLSDAEITGAGEGAGHLVIRPEDVVCGESGPLPIERIQEVFLGDRVLRRLTVDGIALESTCNPWEVHESAARAAIRRAHFVAS